MSLPTTFLFLTFLAFILSLIIAVLGYGFFLRLSNRSRRATVLSELKRHSNPKARIVGFFHPYWSVLFECRGIRLISGKVTQAVVGNACFGQP